MTAVAREWVLASSNVGKQAEISALLADLRLRVIPQTELGVESASETARTYVENALIKAHHAAAVTGMPTIADDSGLSVEALDGRPGIHSARFAGPGCTPADNIELLLRMLANVREPARLARFYCVIVALRAPDDPAPIIAQGQWLGRIALAPKGSGGFGYDPVFYDPVLRATAAELSAAAKNRVSHRAGALRALRATLQRESG